MTTETLQRTPDDKLFKVTGSTTYADGQPSDPGLAFQTVRILDAKDDEGDVYVEVISGERDGLQAYVDELSLTPLEEFKKKPKQEKRKMQIDTSIDREAGFVSVNLIDIPITSLDATLTYFATPQGRLALAQLILINERDLNA